MGDSVFTEQQIVQALIRRRIKFVAEKGSMARLFAKGTNSDLQEKVFQAVTPALLYSLRSQNAYDEWLKQRRLE
ncbi:MAG TPA: hypothetical protein VM940_00345 [Chthoniobacterales bacterium]|jgi:hypothetical protein|nr:hypothetical protein [Chthoniobacterales bacterium]